MAGAPTANDLMARLRERVMRRDLADRNVDRRPLQEALASAPSAFPSLRTALLELMRGRDQVVRWRA